MHRFFFVVLLIESRNELQSHVLLNSRFILSPYLPEEMHIFTLHFSCRFDFGHPRLCILFPIGTDFRRCSVTPNFNVFRLGRRVTGWHAEWRGCIVDGLYSKYLATSWAKVSLPECKDKQQPFRGHSGLQYIP